MKDTEILGEKVFLDWQIKLFLQNFRFETFGTGNIINSQFRSNTLSLFIKENKTQNQENFPRREREGEIRNREKSINIPGMATV